MLFILFSYLLLTYAGAADLMMPLHIKLIAVAMFLESAIFEIILWDNARYAISRRKGKGPDDEEL